MFSYPANKTPDLKIKQRSRKKLPQSNRNKTTWSFYDRKTFFEAVNEVIYDFLFDFHDVLYCISIDDVNESAINHLAKYVIEVKSNLSDYLYTQGHLTIKGCLFIQKCKQCYMYGLKPFTNIFYSSNVKQKKDDFIIKIGCAFSM